MISLFGKPKEDNIPIPDARVLWGRMLLNLKKEGNVLLHSVCIELGNVKLEDNTLKIYVPNEIDYETLKKPQNYSNLVETLQKLGYNLSIEIILDKQSNLKQDVVQKLKQILGVDIEQS